MRRPRLIVRRAALARVISPQSDLWPTAATCLDVIAWEHSARELIARHEDKLLHLVALALCRQTPVASGSHARALARSACIAVGVAPERRKIELLSALLQRPDLADGDGHLIYVHPLVLDGAIPLPPARRSRVAA